MYLGAPDTANQASDKAIAGIERGLLEVVENHDLSAAAVLDRVTALQLFRVGATEDLDPRVGRV